MHKNGNVPENIILVLEIRFRKNLAKLKGSAVRIETFRFHDEYDYEYEIFSILSSVRA